MHIQIDISKLVFASGLKSIELNDVHYEADFQPTEIVDVLIKLKTFLHEQQTKR